jgi:capping protein (actin filament) muscle Z-line, alpha
MTLESVLASAPPGHLDSLVTELSTLMTVPTEVVQRIKANASISSEIGSHPLAESLAKEFQLYQQEYYSQVDYKFSITGDLNVTTCSERIDVKNCYAGLWRGDWKINVLSDTDATLEGSILIHVYCHETCNVQLKTKKSYDSLQIRCSSSSSASLAKAIQAKIATIESDVVAELDDMYHTMDEKLKALRRVLPVMRTRLEWNVLAHRMVKKLEETTTVV